MTKLLLVASVPFFSALFVWGAVFVAARLPRLYRRYLTSEGRRWARLERYDRQIRDAQKLTDGK